MRKKINPLRGIDYFTTFVTQGQAIFLICGGMLCDRNIWYKTGLPLPSVPLKRGKPAPIPTKSAARYGQRVKLGKNQSKI